MLGSSKAVFFLVLSLFIDLAVAKNPCRQCNADLVIHFKDHMSYSNVAKYVAGTLGKCATGAQYDMTKTFPSDCQIINNEQACRTWEIYYYVWRYCGNGGIVNLKRTGFCSGDVCAIDDRLYMKCVKSVQCAGTCNCSECGC